MFISNCVLAVLWQFVYLPQYAMGLSAVWDCGGISWSYAITFSC